MSRLVTFAAMSTASFLVFSLGSSSAHAKSVKEAYEAYEKGQYEDAAKGFLEAEVDHPDNLQYAYNRAVSQYKQGDYKSAKEGFSKSAGSENSVLSLKSLFNLANTQVALGELEDAAKSYEKLLSANPKDHEARENLEWVKKKLEEKKQKQDQKKSDKNDQKQKQDQKDQQQNQDQKQDQNKEEEQKAQQNNQKENKEQNADEQKSQQEPAAQNSQEDQRQQQNQPMNKAEAEKLLRSIDEKVPRYQLKAEKRVHDHNGKDW